jgi:hypothetical protein
LRLNMKYQVLMKASMVKRRMDFKNVRSVMGEQCHCRLSAIHLGKKIPNKSE